MTECGLLYKMAAFYNGPRRLAMVETGDRSMVNHSGETIHTVHKVLHNNQ